MRVQCSPPSWVAHNPGPYSQPLRASANVTALTCGPAEPTLSPSGGSRSIGGEDTMRQLSPASAVLTTTALHGSGCPGRIPKTHRTLPSTKPVDGDTKLAPAG